ncbi:MAG: hypothetical protein AAF950_14455 [Pseudomonadota bacterium]
MLDFSQFRGFQSYADLTEFNRSEYNPENYGATENAIVSRQQASVQALLSLGLFSEIEGALVDVPSAASRVYGSLREVLEGTGTKDPEIFERLSGCSVRGRFWLGVQSLNEDKAIGSKLIGENFEVFRDLPYWMRVFIAIQVVEDSNNNVNDNLIDRLLASFTDEEVEMSPRLEFIIAMNEFQRVGTDAEGLIKGALADPTRRKDVLKSLFGSIDKDPSIGDTVQLDEALDILVRAEDVKTHAAALRFVLDRLRDTSDYGEFLKLSRMSVLNIEEAQQEINKTLIGTLFDDLDAPDFETQWGALSFLHQYADMFDGTDAREDMFSRAAQVSKTLGNFQLAASFWNRIGQEAKSDYAEAELAHRRGDLVEAVRIAIAHPDDAKLSYLAASIAIQQRQQAEFFKVIPLVLKNDAYFVKLLEEDSLSGDPFIPKNTINEFDRTNLSDELVDRFERALRLRGESDLSPFESIPVPSGLSTLAPDILSKSVPELY